VRLEDAPPAGWYPDPERGERLRWWEGADWTDQWRAPPTAGELVPARQSGQRETAPTRSTLPRPDQVRDRAGETEQIVTQVREAAREEITRAATELTRRAQSTFDRYGAVAVRFLRRVWRWARAAIVVAAVLVVAWFVLQFIAQAAFLDWIGDRIDNLFAG
jgi:hypothetical protein